MTSSEVVPEANDEELIIYTALLGILGLICSYLLFRRLSAPAAPVTIKRVQKKEAPQNTGPQITVFYGSQTGTAEDMATKFSKEMKRHGFNPKAVDMEDFEMDGMEELADTGYVVFFTATHGEGDPTDNAKAFYEWLKEPERESGELSKLQFSVFGLGNKQYEEYNSMGRFFNTRLEELGATRIGEYGEGDDDGDIEADYDSWKEANLPVIKTHFLGADAANIVAPPELEFNLVDVPAKAQASAAEKGIWNTFLAASKRSIIDNQVWLPGKLITKYELQTNSDRSTLHLEIEPTGSGDYSFQPGDHIGVRCENNPHMVAAIAARLGLELKQVISLKAIDRGASKPFRFPSPCTVLVALTAWLDIQATTRPEVLQFMAQYATDDEEAVEMKRLGSPEAKEEYTTLVDKGMNLIELLDKFKSLQLPLHALLELLPRLQTRFYSISSSLRLHKNAIHLTAAVVRYPNQTEGLPDREGVATSWFDRMREGNTIQICMRSAGFHLPADKSKPVLMVGPGTGIAPFRGYIQEYMAIKRSGADTGKMFLFFGCRSSKQDFIYQQELQQAQDEGALTQLFSAFSRDQEHKVYVQHMLEQQAQLVADSLLKEEGSFYILSLIHISEPTRPY
eukprot:TRINITY_DN12521_c0_g1_i1.p1 TRINITY_DN12521_c0_g1~~TRINITY_DN12521_c0_g1_i1.p1  ORF type:complete len:622 (-),score=223.27 TRINITY_DN12521_c0_g1_i1:70-1935(-)